MSEFQKGDVVQLKSGGPRMTISSTEVLRETIFSYEIIEGYVQCDYFAGEERQTEEFDVDIIEKVPEESLGMPPSLT